MRVNSIYPGIVIQNNDPDKNGRVKVFVPGITNTIYDNWNGVVEDKEFSFIDGSILPIMKTLKEDLPWASCATSMFGGDTSQLNVGESPVALERVSDALIETPPKDAFENEVFTPGDYSGTSAGLFSVPSVGSHVYVFFKSGDTNYPVYFAVSHGVEDWSGVLSGNYPSTYENTGEGEYINKHVWNSSKHTLEFIDSDNIEELKLSHYCGSNIQMLNDYTSKFTVGVDYTLIQGDVFKSLNSNEDISISGNETVFIGGTENIHIVGNEIVAIDGNESITIGEDNTVTIGGAESRSVGDGQNINVTGDITIKASGSITIQSAGGKIVLDGSGVTITGAVIKLN